MPQPSNDLDATQRNLLSEMASRLLNRRLGTPVESLRRRLGTERTTLNQMVADRFIRVVKGDYVPTYRGLEALGDENLQIVQANLAHVFFVLKQLYSTAVDRSAFTFEEILEGVRRVAPPLDANDVLPALIVGEEFNYYNFPEGIQDRDGHLAVVTIAVAERILDFVSVEEVWGSIGPRVLADGEAVSTEDVFKKQTRVPGMAAVGARGNRGDWEEVGRKLGEGGQSTVYLVRTPERTAERKSTLLEIVDSNPWAVMMANTRDERVARFADAISKHSRADQTSELRAMKVFKLDKTDPEAEAQARQRLIQEITALQKSGLPGFPGIFDSNEAEGWIVTEFFPLGTLEGEPERYRGKPGPALRALRSLLDPLTHVHDLGWVHRDIKRANVFIREDNTLVLGDFGIVFVPDAADRVTRTNERVGPRDYMPEWANLGQRLENVKPSFDVYMLGKLLWTMVDGRALISRERHRHPDHSFDLTKNFPNDPHMYLINAILDKCLVDKEPDCLPAARELMREVDDALHIIDRGGQLLTDEVPRPCRVCGKGNYHAEPLGPVTSGAPRTGTSTGVISMFLPNTINERASLNVRLYTCNYCGHIQFFKPTR